MVDRDIHGRLQALEQEQLTALIEYMLGDGSLPQQSRNFSGEWKAVPQTNTPGTGRGSAR